MSIHTTISSCSLKLGSTNSLRSSATPECINTKKLCEYFGKESVDINKQLPILKLDPQIVFQGWMSKRGGLLSTWKERWFCLCEDKILRIIYNGGIVRYTIDVTLMLSKPQFSWNEADGSGTIKLECIGRNWLFLVNNKEQHETWRKHLNQVSQYNINQASSFLMLGVLQKRGQVNTMWRKRFCRLNRNGIFLYWKCDASGNPKGKVKGHFSLYHATEMKVDKDDEKHFRIYIHQPARIWDFKANSIEEAEKWITSIKGVVGTSHVESPKEVLSNQTSFLPVKKKLTLLDASSCSHHRINSKHPLKSLTVREFRKPVGKNLAVGAVPQERKEDLPLDKNSISNQLNHKQSREFPRKLPSYSSCAILKRQRYLSSQKASNKPAWERVKISGYASDRGVVPVEYRADSFDIDCSITPDRKKETSLEWSVRLPSDKTESTRMTESLQSDQIDPRLLLPEYWDNEHDEVRDIGVSDDDSSYVTTQTRSSTDGVEDWTYEDVLRSAFYRFAGVSPYSNTNLKMSKADLDMLLVCLNQQQHCNRLYDNLSTDRHGLFSIEDFMDCFLNPDTFNSITTTTEYNFLVVTLMTMKNIDPSYSKRISNEDFHSLLETFIDDQDEAEEIFQKYDTDGTGLLHVANLFCFLRDFCVLEDEEEGKYDEMKDYNTYE